MRELYRRLVNAIIKWLLRHCPEAIPEDLIPKDEAQRATFEALVDFSRQTIKQQFHELWHKCPPENLLVLVIVIGQPDQEIDVRGEMADMVQTSPRNEMGDPASLATILGYGHARLSTTAPRFGVVTRVFNPGRYDELNITPDLDATVERWFHDQTNDPRQAIVGWQYFPIPKDELEAK